MTILMQYTISQYSVHMSLPATLKPKLNMMSMKLFSLEAKVLYPLRYRGGNIYYSTDIIQYILNYQ